MPDALWIAGTAAIAALAGGSAVAVTFGRSERRRRQALEARIEATEGSLRTRERSLADERQVQDTILASMEEGVLLFDADERRVFANDALARHLDAVPTSADRLLPLELRTAVRRAGYVGTVIRAEVETGHPARWLRGTALPIGDEGAVLLVVRDVTEARRLDAVRRDFVANASHELKTPLASIRAAAETLRDGALGDPPAAERFTEQLEREAVRLSRIVSDLLDLTRLEAGTNQDERVKLEAVATEEVRRLQEEAREADVRLTLHADGVPSIRGSARDLALMVRNLVDNALRYTPNGGAVDVTITGDADHVVLRVADTGVGIPQRDLDRIFERFYRVDRARSRDTGGTGLGLAIVRHVAENHGAQVSVTSELGRGSTFEVVLPTSPRA